MPLPARLPRLALALLAVSWPAQSLADVVHDMPIDCPRGTEKHLSHNGPYCTPPLRGDCPPGYVPKVRGSTSYCEAPPPAPCPRGTSWESSSPTEASCRLNDRCQSDSDCSSSDNEKCESLSFCLEREQVGRGVRDRSRGTCRTQADCAAFPNSRCGSRATCTNPSTRRHEAQRIAAAKNVPPERVPAPYEASAYGGSPPRYPILRAGQKLPPLPDVPEPPDDTPPPPVVETPDAGNAEDAGFAAPPTGGEPPAVENGPADPPVNTPRPPSGHAGCAGCIIGTSERDTAGWAALMSLLGVGIAVWRKFRKS